MEEFLNQTGDGIVQSYYFIVDGGEVSKE